MDGTAEIGMSPVDSATGRDVPHTRLRAILATPSGSSADQAPPRRQRQHFRVRDPMRSLRLTQTAPKAPARIQRHSRMTFGTFANGQRGAQFVHPNRPFQLTFNGKMPWTQRQLNLTP